MGEAQKINNFQHYCETDTMKRVHRDQLLFIDVFCDVVDLIDKHGDQIVSLNLLTQKLLLPQIIPTTSDLHGTPDREAFERMVHLWCVRRGHDGNDEIFDRTHEAFEINRRKNGILDSSLATLQTHTHTHRHACSQYKKTRNTQIQH